MKKRTIILLHIAFWQLFLISNVWQAYQFRVFVPNQNDRIGLSLFARTLVIETGYITIPITCFYIACGLVGPALFVKRQYVRAVLFTLLTIVAATLLRYLLEYHFFLPVLGFDNYNGHKFELLDFSSNVFFYYFPRHFLYGLMYFFARNWYRARHQQEVLMREKAAAELALLKSQVNPHFLFNTINDIYSLAYQKSEQAPVALLKLSEILRYMLREGSAETVGIKQEIKYLESLVELQRISAKGKVYIDFEVEGYIGEQQIAPMLFISFVENAFKHGVLNDPENPILIRLVATTDVLEFTVRNRKNRYEKDKTGGIGLNNIHRRLELMYPGKYQLSIVDEEETFHIKLTLKTGA